MQQLIKMGVKTRLQAQIMLTDHLCQSLEPSYGISRDVRRNLLDLLGVEWQQQLWSASEVLLWEQWPVEPTAHGEDSDDEGPPGPWRQETKDFRDIMIELSRWEYLNIFEDDIKYMLLAIPTARNLLYYLCDADFDAVGIPVGARKVLRAECLRRVVVACGKQERQAVRRKGGKQSGKEQHTHCQRS